MSVNDAIALIFDNFEWILCDKTIVKNFSFLDVSQVEKVIDMG